MRAKSAAQNILHFAAETVKGIYGCAGPHNSQSCLGNSKKSHTTPVQVISVALKKKSG